MIIHMGHLFHMKLLLRFNKSVSNIFSRFFLYEMQLKGRRQNWLPVCIWNTFRLIRNHSLVFYADWPYMIRHSIAILPGVKGLNCILTYQKNCTKRKQLRKVTQFCHICGKLACVSWNSPQATLNFYSWQLHSKSLADLGNTLRIRL